jgi:hypothetical protein
LNDRSHLAISSLDWIARHWPALVDQVPPESRLFSLGYGVGDGCCTHPGWALPEWFRSDGGRRFAVALVPDGFFACGVQNRGTNECVFALWRRGPRRFWFYDR